MEDEETDDPSPLTTVYNEKKKKQPLAQTVSLPVTTKEHYGASNRTEEASSPAPSKQAPPEKSIKSWSFGNMAKAVGCGVTAFGTGVVHGSLAVAQATGSGVIHSSKAVGEGVVQGTKAVGEGVFHSTKAAGRATVAASEIMGSGVVSGVSAIGSTTIQAGKASVTAVQDTTKWMITRTETILGECQVHVVLPDEDIDDICKNYNIDPVHLIKANRLQKRDLRVGKKLLIPQTENLTEIKRLQHEKDMLQVNAKGNSNEGTLTFTYESLFFSSQNIFIEINNSDVHIISFFILEKKDLEMPALLRPENVMNQKNSFPETSSIANVDAVPRIIIKTKDGADYEYEVEKNDILEIISNCKLWYPMTKLNIPVNFEECCYNEKMTVDLKIRSVILTKDLISQIYVHLPCNAQISKWQKIFSSAEDGYSLQNFYRKTAQYSEPFLLAFSDKKDDIFGAFVTCVPRISDSFIGSGKMWLFSVENERIRVYRWSGKNEYFFQGQQACFIIGSSNGKFGIYIDSDLNNGRIQSCETFVAWPKEEKDFVVKYFECWNFK